jgi:hypothetical protein
MRLSILSILLTIGTAMDETNQQPLMSLQTDRTTIISTEWNRPLYQGIKCDSGGRVFLRACEPGNSRAPVIRVNATGNGIVNFTFPASGGLKEATVYDFAIANDGVLYQLAQKGDEVFTIRYSEEGSPEGFLFCHIRWKRQNRCRNFGREKRRKAQT